MPLFYAATPGLLLIGFAMLAFGGLALMASPLARAEVRRITMTGLVVTAIGGAPALMGGMQAAAHADQGMAAHPVQQAMLSGMGSQIVYD